MKKVEIKSVLEPDFLEAQFQAVQDYLQDVNFINYGGCGISAYAMFLWLQKSNMLTEDVKVVFLHFSTSKKDFQTNQSFYLQGQGNPVAPEHVVLMKNGVMIDSSGVYKKINNYAYQLSVSIEKAEDFLVNSLNSDSWNNMFDRPIVVPIIEKDLGISFRADMRRQNKSWDLETTSN
jgi:hypothetical protein